MAKLDNDTGFSDVGLGILYRKAAIQVAKIFVNTRVTPNQVTIMGFILGVISAMFFALGDYLFLILGIILLHLRIVFDFADGAVARAKNMCTNYGNWLDMVMDRLVDPLVFFGLCWGLYQEAQNPLIWLFGFTSISTIFLNSSFTIVTEINMPSGTNIIIGHAKKKEFLRNFFYSRINTYFLLTIAIIINQIYLYLIGITVYYGLFYLASVIYFSVKLKNVKKKSAQK